ncbi:MAG TPA: ATP-binding protein [Steroidobacteraceae bacterium]|nr:ATP-binding protein [Steroidobacteraceae bacterium]
MADANTRYPRVIHPQLTADLRLYPVVAVMGARQVGKSTLCEEIAEAQGFARRTLDDRDVREQAIADPEGLLSDLGDGGAFIDEVQRAPDLMLAIKAIVDRDRRNGQYLLSGSNQPKVGKSVSDSLVGRATYRTLRPLTLSELRFDEEFPGWSFLFGPDEMAVIAELERRAAASGALGWRSVVQTGGFPRAVAAPPEQRLRILDDYVEIFSRRDILEILEVESAPRLEAFVRLTAARTGQELNVSDLSKDLGTPVTTIRRWLEALQRSYLIELIPPYSRNSGQRVIKAPKLYSVDAALALAASRGTTPTGFHLETMVAGDLLVWRDIAPMRNLYHWRLGSGQEVDFVLEENRQLLPVEVKAAETVGADAARHVATFRERHANTPRGIVLSSDPEIRIIRPGILACPWWAVI